MTGAVVLVAAASAPGRNALRPATSIAQSIISDAAMEPGVPGHGLTPSPSSGSGPTATEPATAPGIRIEGDLPASDRGSADPLSSDPVSGDPAGSTPQHTSPQAPATSVRVVARYSGSGDWTTKHFRVRAHRPWELAYTYTCPAQLALGLFQVEADTPSRGAVSMGGGIELTGTGGNGSSWVYPDGTRHYLVVTSNCSWTITVRQLV